MPVLGAVLNLASEPALQQAALEFLGDHPGITLGQAQAYGLPVVLEFEDRSEERDLLEALQTHPGILLCSVAYADFSETIQETEE